MVWYAGNGMLHTLNDILLIAKNRNGVEAVSSPVSLAKIVSRTTNSLTHMAQTKNITFEVKQGIFIPTTAKASSLTAQVWSSMVCMTDEVRLSQICNNLVSNAIKFASNNGSVFVRAHVMPSTAVHEVIYSSLRQVLL
jgi:signal transduction histidine kinase